MKKTLALLLALALALTMVTMPALAADARPLEGKKLSYWYPMWAWEAEFVGAGDMNNLYFYSELERVTGCEIEWILPPVDNSAAIAAYNVLVASKDLPDIVTHPYYTYYPGGADKAIDDGVYIDLKPLLPENAPDYWSLIHEDPELVRQVTTDASNIWCFYMIDSFAQPAFGGMVWRKDFLDKVGLGVPTTVEEVHTALKAFKEQLGLTRPSHDLPGTLAYAYGVWTDFQKDTDNKVSFGPAMEGWKAYLTEMNKWYAEGLIPADYLQPPKQNIAMLDGTTGQTNAGFNNMTEWSSLAKSQNIEGFELIASPYAKLKAEDQLTIKNVAYRAQQNCTAVTTSCKEPEVAVQWLNEKFTEEFKIKSNYGEEGVSYTMVDGKPTYTDAVVHPTEPGMTLGILLYKYALGKGPYYRVMDRNWFTHLPVAIDAMYKVWDPSSDGTSVLPTPFLTMPAVEGEEFSALMADINTYVKECTNKFITGEMSIEKDWDAYLAQLESMDLARAIELRQASYDRYLTR